MPFLAGDGEAIAAVRAHDWSATPLGPVECWPAELVSAACYVLEARLPMALVWGEALVTIHNDAFRPILGERHGAPGRSFQETWAAAWEGIGPVVGLAMAGEASFIQDLPLRIDRHGYPEDAFFTSSYSPVRLADGQVRGVIVTVMETTAAVQSRRQAAVVNSELGHRLKNTMAMVQAVAVQSLRQVTERELVEAFTDRVAAMGRAHDVLLRERWERAPITEVVGRAMAVHRGAGSGGRITIAGPDLMLGSRAVLSLAMLLHELATNATKYGSLSTEMGRVDITWRLEPGEMVLQWAERDGPPVSEPTRAGFGSRLINMGLVGTGHVHQRYAPAGFSVVFRAPQHQLLQP